MGYEKVILDGQTLTLPEEMELDLGAVGKGYAGDLTADLVKEHGLESALLNIGGNIQQSDPGRTEKTGGLPS